MDARKNYLTDREKEKNTKYTWIGWYKVTRNN
jgi:hypothetical protein